MPGAQKGHSMEYGAAAIIGELASHE